MTLELKVSKLMRTIRVDCSRVIFSLWSLKLCHSTEAQQTSRPRARVLFMVFFSVSYSLRISPAHDFLYPRLDSTKALLVAHFLLFIRWRTLNEIGQCYRRHCSYRSDTQRCAEGWRRRFVQCVWITVKMTRFVLLVVSLHVVIVFGQFTNEEIEAQYDGCADEVGQSFKRDRDFSFTPRKPKVKKKTEQKRSSKSYHLA